MKKEILKVLVFNSNRSWRIIFPIRQTQDCFRTDKKGGKDDLYCKRLQPTFRNGGVQ
jgi:hypothetical protein